MNLIIPSPRMSPEQPTPTILTLARRDQLVRVQCVRCGINRTVSKMCLMTRLFGMAPATPSTTEA